ncbi:AAA family ATPase [Egicoccus sp. AB-alg6-2]|uniref:ATP-binding protein n=1 Tax=Egicoccus sp. AB-alg6-2 TaxID=3242692 RepID=UPI00359D3638
MDLLERDDQLAVLWEAFRCSQRGAGRVVLVSGEAGVGKSSLARAFVADAATRSRVRWGCCDPLTTPRAHGPLRDIAGSAGGQLAAVLEADSSADERHGAFLDLLRQRPVGTVIVIEDLHWADDATLDLLRFVTRRIGSCRALLLLTYRDDELHAAHPLRALLGDLATSPDVVRVPLLPLTLEGIRALAGAHPDVESLHRVTGGNAFFVTEILAAGDPAVLPSTVRDAVLARLTGLPPDARALLDVLALARPPIPTGLALEVGNAAPPALDAGVERGVLVDGPAGLRFRHDLARRVVADAIPPGRRAQLHGRLLAWLEHHPAADVADLAHHAEAAGDAEAILRHAREAAEQAADLGAHQESAAQYARALRWSARLPPEERVDLLERHSLASYFADDAVGAVASRARAVAIRRTLGDHQQLGDSLRWLSRMSWVAGQNQEAERAGREALELLADVPGGAPLAMAHSNLAQLAMLGRDLERARRHGNAAIALATEHGDTRTLVHALNNVGAAEYLGGLPEQGREKLERSLELARRFGYHDDAARAYGNLGSGMAEVRAYDLAIPHLEAGIAFCADRRLDYFGHYLRAWRARVHFELGKWIDAEEEARELLALPHVATVTTIVALTVLGRVAVRRGHYDASAPLDDAWELARTTGDLQRTWPAAAGLAERAHWSSAHPVPDGLTAQVYDQALRIGHAWAIGELGYWRHQAGLLADLPPEAAEPFRLLASGDAAPAAEAWRRLGGSYEEATALSRDRDVTRLRRAFDLAAELSAGPLVARIGARLRDRGAPVPRGPRPATVAHPAGLTPRQADVLALVTAGLSDAEIAERLFISPKTAGHHVSAILRKLQARSRLELAVAATRLDITAPAGRDAT